MLLLSSAIFFGCNSKHSENSATPSEGFNVSGVDQKDLAAAEKKMFVDVLNSDEYWRTDVDEDYITINADGVMADKEETMQQRAKRDSSRSNPFALVTETKTSERKVRKYGDVAVINGKAEFMGGSNRLAEVYYTEIWLKKNGKWMFNGWQGTMTKAMQEMMMNHPPK